MPGRREVSAPETWEVVALEMREVVTSETRDMGTPGVTTRGQRYA